MPSPWKPATDAHLGEPGSRSARLPRNPGIDLLRGLSIVLVVLHHTGLRIPLRHSVLVPWLPRWLLNGVIYNGYEAVFIFFVISGFLITRNSLVRWGSLAAIDVRAFYRRRAARILPCLLALIAVLSLLHLAGATHYVIDRPGQSLGRAIVAAVGLHLNWYEGATGYLPASWDVLWSLSIEELFYLAFPLCCLVLGRSRWLVPALAALALSLPATHAALASNQIWQEKAYLPGMAAIAMGVLTALTVAKWTPRKTTVSLLLGLGLVGVVAILFFETYLWSVLRDGSVLLLAISAASLIAALHYRQVGGASRPMRPAAWLRSFGRLSYEVYLSHMFAIWLVFSVYRATGASESWGFVWYLPALGLSWLLGWLVARLISLPAERALLSLRREPLRARPSSRTATDGYW